MVAVLGGSFVAIAVVGLDECNPPDIWPKEPESKNDATFFTEQIKSQMQQYWQR